MMENENGMGNGWWIILLFILLLGFGGRGFGGGNDWQRSSVQDNYVLTSDFATLERKLDGLANGQCNIGYTNAQLINGVNTNILQTGYGITNAINGVGRDMERGFADTQYRDGMNTSALMQSGHADADRIIAKLDSMEMARKDEKIAEQNQTIFSLQLKASQEAQNNYLVGQLGYQCPKPAYVVQPPQQVTFATNCCGGTAYAGTAAGCGCGNF